MTFFTPPSPSYPNPRWASSSNSSLAAQRRFSPPTRSSGSSLDDALGFHQASTSTPAFGRRVDGDIPHHHHQRSSYHLTSSAYPTIPYHPSNMAVESPYDFRRPRTSVPDTDTDPDIIPDSYQPKACSSSMTTSASLVLSRPLMPEERAQLTQLDALRLFLLTAPAKWNGGSSSASASSTPPALHRFPLPDGEPVSCVRWRGLFYITGTDVVRALVFRFAAFGRPVRHMKKFEEGVFSDLRNLKPGLDATLEEPKSPFLDLLFKHQCIRTQKKQKVFYWFSVPHDRLFLDALERDLKRERTAQEPTSEVVGEPAQSFAYDPRRPLVDQFLHSASGGTDEANLLARFAGSEGPEGYKQRRSNRTTAQRTSSSDDESGDSGSVSPPPSGPTPSSPTAHGGYGYAAEDANLTAADMFLRQANGAFGRQQKEQRVDAAQRKEDEKERKEHEGLLRKQEHATASAEEQARTIRERLVKERGAVAEGEVMDLDTHPSGTDSGYSSARSLAFPASTLASAYGPSMATMPSSLQGVTIGPASTLTSGLPMAVTGAPAVNFAAPAQPTAGADQGTTAAGAGPEKPFTCPVTSCTRAFKRAEHLRRHLRTHTSERPFVCDACDKRFARSDNLAQHMRVHARAAVTGQPEAEDTEVEYAGLTDGGISWPTGLDETDDTMSETSSGFSNGSVMNDDLPPSSLWLPTQAEMPSMTSAQPIAMEARRTAMPIHLRHHRSASSGADVSTPSHSAPPSSLGFDPTALGPHLHLPSGRPRSWTPNPASRSEAGARRPLTAAVRERSSIHGSTAYSPYALAALHARSTQNSPARLDSQPDPMASFGMVASNFVHPSENYAFDATGIYASTDTNTHATYPPVSSSGIGGYSMPHLSHSLSYPGSIPQPLGFIPAAPGHFATPSVSQQPQQQQFGYDMAAFVAEPETMGYDTGSAQMYMQPAPSFHDHIPSSTMHEYFHYTDGI